MEIVRIQMLTHTSVQNKIQKTQQITKLTTKVVAANDDDDDNINLFSALYD